MAQVSIKSKLVPGKDLGNPSNVKNLKDGETRLLMGTVIGEVSRMVTRTMPTGEVYEGFGGTFEAIPADPNLPTVRSGVLYLPGGFFELIANPFKEMSASDDTARLQFGFEVYAVKDSNPQGYAWQYVPLGEPGKSDPLAAIRSSLGVGGQAQLTDQSQNASAPAPKRAAGGKR